MTRSTITRKYLKTVRHAYVYPDGHAVLLHRESYKGIDVEFATVHERAFEVHRSFGRLVVHSRQALAHLLCSDWVGWKSAALANGSDNTKDAGIPVQTIYLSFMGTGETWITSMPSMISSEFTAQDDPASTFAETISQDKWSNYPIAEVVRVVTKT